jgi:hypothetical protein
MININNLANEVEFNGFFFFEGKIHNDTIIINSNMRVVICVLLYSNVSRRFSNLQFVIILVQ